MTENNLENQEEQSFGFSFLGGDAILDNLDKQKYAETKEPKEDKKEEPTGVAKELENKSPIFSPADDDTNLGLDALDKDFYNAEDRTDEIVENKTKPKATKEDEEHNTFKTLLENIYGAEVPEDIVLTEDNFKQMAKEAMLEEVKRELSPEGMEIMEHLKNGGSIQDYFEIAASDDLTTADLKESAFNQKYMLKEYLAKTTKWSEAKVDNYINSLDEDALLHEATEAQSEWGALQAADKAEVNRINLERKNRAIKEAEDVRNLIKTSIINKTAFNNVNLNLTPKVKQQLTDYMLKPTVKLEDGRVITQNEADYMAEMKDMRSAKSADGAIIQAYQRMKKYDILGSITKEAAKKGAETLAQTLKAQNEGRIKGNYDSEESPELSDEIKKKKMNFSFTSLYKNV